MIYPFDNHPTKIFMRNIFMFWVFKSRWWADSAFKHFYEWLRDFKRCIFWL